MTAATLDTVMMLAAGLGTRMRPLTLTAPKPLIRVGGKPLIDWCIDLAATGGIKHAVVNVHHLADQMAAHLARTSRLRLTVSDETDRLLETGGGVVKALPLLGSDPFFVMGTDAVVVDRGRNSFARLRDVWRPDLIDCVLLLHPMTTAKGFDGPGDFFLEPDGRPRRRGAAARAPYVYAGLYLVHPRVFVGERAEPFSMNWIWDRLIAADRLRAVAHDGHWFHVGTPEAVAPTDAALRALGLAA